MPVLHVSLCILMPFKLYQGFCWINLILCLHNGDTLNTYMKEFCSYQIIIDKIVAMRTLSIFLDCIEQRLFMWYDSAYTDRLTPIRACN